MVPAKTDRAERLLGEEEEPLAASISYANTSPPPRSSPPSPSPRKQAAIRDSGATVVVHAAGPFQRSRNYAVLEAAMATGVSYVDICDDAEYAKG